MPNTEIAIFPIRKDTNVKDPNSEEGKAYRELVTIISSQPGFLSWHAGTQIEHPQKLQLSVVWDRYESHMACMRSKEYPTVLEKANVILDTSDNQKVQMHHVDLGPDTEYRKALVAPVTEIATVYFDGGPPEGYLDDVMKFGKIAFDAKGSGLKAFSAGITYEDLEIDGIKGKAGIMFNGWESIEKHMAFRETEIFKQNIGLMRSVAKKIEVHHVSFTKDS